MLFLSTPSARRATRLFTYRCACCGISIHALREEGDSLSLRDRFAAQNFYPRPPRGGRLGVLCKDADFLDISIHALREEGDPPRRGSACMLPIFLSTPSARRATHHPRLRSGGQKISIHALREEGDQNSIALIESGKRFLSTPSARRATLTLYHADVLRLISIHALREEGDAGCRPAHLGLLQFLSTPSARRATMRAAFTPSRWRHFYPRPPRGGRPFFVLLFFCFLKFLSTPSARRATKTVVDDWRQFFYFYPRPPRGGRPPCSHRLHNICRISIHALREEGDPQRNHPAAKALISIHALREEGDSV